VRKSPVPALLLLLSLILFAAPARSLEYPATKKVDQKDTYAGDVVVADPYRWLEADVRESDEVRAWVTAQNDVTFSYLESLPHRESIREKLSTVWDYEKYTIPTKKGGRYFFRKNDGLQNQSVLYTQKTLDEAPRLLIDPNRWSKDGTVALTSFVPSPDGRHIAYGAAEAGSDWVVWRVMEIESGTILPDEIRWVKFNQPTWTRDGRGFFYARYPKPVAGEAFQSLNKNQKVFYHRLGTEQAEDVVVHYTPGQPEWSQSARVTDDGRYLILSVSKGSGRQNRVFYKNLETPYAMTIPLIEDFENEYDFVGNDGSLFYFRTDLDASRRRLIAIDIQEPDREKWSEIIPESAHLLADVRYVGGRFVGRFLRDARTAVEIFSRDGKKLADVDLGGLGSASGFAGDPKDPETFYSIESYNIAPSVYRYDVATGEKKLLFQSKVSGLDPQNFEVKQVFYQSKDGTRVPMFIAHRKGLVLDGSNPTLLYGYGGFNVSQTPRFSASRLVWMQMGGVFALANLRGGGEYGAEWHRAGTKLQKQNVFDDFIAAAEYLIEKRYTSRKKLAIQGGSNGGLLVGAAMTQRPELFAAALPAVGVMDMLRFHRFTAGRFWVEDYGSSEHPDEFRALHAYSPYHNLKKGTRYPATLVTTADTDDRVVPGHSFKFAAALQEAHAGDVPVLIRIETRAGHGAGKPTSKQIEEAADLWSFLASNLEMKVK
jgi:prolyl oligopeptidase